MQDNIKCLQSKGRETPNKIGFKHNFGREFIQTIWQKLLKILLSDANEIQVNQKVDRQGNKYWQAYDQITGHSFASGSEVDVRMWIEQIYRYQAYDRTKSSNW
ncbi:hypothetical protein [Nostoc sp. CMAA1605]|uniref:hypothetical protein n=1 Tax=Nostoc sp. CMAA1605 TaxID=2055159 RepID=UPI001F20A00A|nr:hypothetical protein [Nostoc sp. CMAA1605]MCF4967836.1 hypothetical protein [Nostoc sp. CMAA1605]